MQPVTETVYRDVPVTEYRQETRTVRKPVLRTVYEDQAVTAYRQIMIPQTVEVPSVSYQTVTECQPITVNRSFWRTVYQPVQKGCACDYDSRPGLMGWMNRQSYEMRMAFTPNYITRREFVPNVQAYNVPMQRTVAVPSTRSVTYNVAKLEPYQTTQKVARTITEYIDQEVTAYVPYTTTKTVAVGTRTRMAYVDPFGGGSTTALGPTPDRTAEQRAVQQRAQTNTPKKQTSSNNSQFDGRVQQQSFQFEQPSPIAPPSSASPATATPIEEPPPFGSLNELGQAPKSSVPSAVRVAGWRPTRSNATRPQPGAGPSLPMVAAN
jgi:hypothetical protein